MGGHGIRQWLTIKIKSSLQIEVQQTWREDSQMSDSDPEQPSAALLRWHALLSPALANGSLHGQCTVKRPHSALGYWPPVPVTIASKPTSLDEMSYMQ